MLDYWNVGGQGRWNNGRMERWNDGIRSQFRWPMKT